MILLNNIADNFGFFNFIIEFMRIKELVHSWMHLCSLHCCSFGKYAFRIKSHARKTLFTYQIPIDIQFSRFFCSENNADNFVRNNEVDDFPEK